MATIIAPAVVAGPFLLNWVPTIFGTHSASPNSGEATLNSNNLGVVGPRGIREIRKYEDEDIPADLVGNAAVNAVELCSQLFLEFDLEEANLLAVMQMSQPQSNVASETVANYALGEGEVGIPGRLHSDSGGSLVLMPAYGLAGAALNTAGSQSTPVRIYGFCRIASGFELTKNLSSRRRTIPMRLRCFPFNDGTGRLVFYTRASSFPT